MSPRKSASPKQAAKPAAKKTARSPESADTANLPRYELRLSEDKKKKRRLEVWQLPSPATPRLEEAEYVAAIQGTAMRVLEPRLLKQLHRLKISLSEQLEAGEQRTWPLEEELALSLGLLFRALAPMRNLDRIREVADGIEAMSREEAGYWLGMAMHRSRPRRVLAALRMLLTSP